MKSILRISVVALGLAAFGGACGKGGDSCDKLTKAVAKAAGAPADKVGPLIDKELTGPNGEALEGEQREAACKMIVSEKAALEGYANMIKAEVAKE